MMKRFISAILIYCLILCAFAYSDEDGGITPFSVEGVPLTTTGTLTLPRAMVNYVNNQLAGDNIGKQISQTQTTDLKTVHETLDVIAKYGGYKGIMDIKFETQDDTFIYTPQKDESDQVNFKVEKDGFLYDSDIGTYDVQEFTDDQSSNIDYSDEKEQYVAAISNTVLDDLADASEKYTVVGGFCPVS